MRLADLPNDDKPREKALTNGISSLSVSELLALIIGSGYKGVNAVELAQQVLVSFAGLSSLFDSDFHSLRRKGLNEVKTLRLLACFELSKRVNSPDIKVDRKELKYSNIVDYFSSLDLSNELVVLFIYSRNGKLKKIVKMYQGTSSNVCFSPIEIIKEIHRNDGHSFLIIHNHPSGNPTPSKADFISTKKLDELCESMNIKMNDHLIVGKDTYYSFKQNENRRFKSTIDFVKNLMNIA